MPQIRSQGYETGITPEDQKVVMVGDTWVSEDEAAEYAAAEAEALRMLGDENA